METIEMTHPKARPVRKIEPDDRSLGIIIEEDPQEKEFDRYLKLWMDGKVTYREVYEKLPDYDNSMLEKLAQFVLDTFRKLYR